MVVTRGTSSLRLHVRCGNRAFSEGSLLSAPYALARRPQLMQIRSKNLASHTWHAK